MSTSKSSPHSFNLGERERERERGKGGDSKVNKVKNELLYCFSQCLSAAELIAVSSCLVKASKNSCFC